MGTNKDKRRTRKQKKRSENNKQKVLKIRKSLREKAKLENLTLLELGESSGGRV